MPDKSSSVAVENASDEDIYLYLLKALAVVAIDIESRDDRALSLKSKWFIGQTIIFECHGRRDWNIYRAYRYTMVVVAGSIHVTMHCAEARGREAGMEDGRYKAARKSRMQQCPLDFMTTKGDVALIAGVPTLAAELLKLQRIKEAR